MAPSADPATWTHEPSIIKEDELREVAALLGKGFRVHHPDAVGGISLSHNPNRHKYMVMHYHSVENGFRLPLHGLVRDICLHFGFAPGQLTANAHKYVVSYILRCCALDRTPTLDEFLVLFSIVHSPIDLPSVVRRSSISRTKFVAAPLAEAAYYALREEGGLIPHHSLRDARLYKKADFYYPLGPDPIPFEGVSSHERSKAPPVVESNQVESSSGSQAQGNSTALAIRKPAAALEAIPISAIPGLRKPTPSQKQPRPLTASSGSQSTTPAAASGGLELPNPDSLDREEDELLDQPALKRPTVQPQPEVNNTTPPDATIPQGVEEEADRQKEPEASPATEKEVGGQEDTEAPPETERETERQPPTGLQANLEKMRGSMQEPITPQARPDLLALNALHSMEQAQQSLLTLTEEYLGGAWGNYRAVVVLKEKDLAVKALQHKVDSLEQQVQALQGENAKLKVDGSAELVAERSRVTSLQEQIATYQRGTQDLETQFDRLRAQISSLESKASASEDKVGSLKAEVVERESRISELEDSLRNAKQEGAHFSDFVVKHMEAKRLTLEKLEKERQTASELQSRVRELEKTTTSHQEESKVFIDLTLFGTSSSSDDDFPASPAQSNDMAGLSPGKFSRLYPAPRLPAPSPPSLPSLPSGRIDWGSMTLQDFALYQRMRRARFGRSFPIVEAEPSRERRTTSPNLLKPPNDGSSLGAPAPCPGTWEDYDIEEAADSAACPSSKRRSPWRGAPSPSC
ncbi:unnamed protein product [Cuscuta campestris]|uniref:Uncharacterized protein n=1 Tax=Cuscuta campestris TaxID=132261 RepID=A0A484L0L5_9ASTE|nr:unnamed protein product [Cuscuta campestris]